MSVAVLERSHTDRKPPIVNYKSPKSIDVNRGEVWWVELDGHRGSEQGGRRPALIISNQLGNTRGTTVIVALISAQVQKAKMPTHVILKAVDTGMPEDSFVMLEQVRTIDKLRLIEKIATLDELSMRKVKNAHEISCSEMFG